jgi:transposase-like protein
MIDDFETVQIRVEIDETIGWRKECPTCGDRLMPVRSKEPDGWQRWQCMGCAKDWWHRPGHGMRDRQPNGV